MPSHCHHLPPPFPSFFFPSLDAVEAYINACRDLGLPDHYNFMTVDLYEGKNMKQVRAGGRECVFGGLKICS